jgi:hydrogenase maturation factor
MIRLDSTTKKTLIELHKDSGFLLDGNIIKIIDVSDDTEFSNYIGLCVEKDKETRRKRLEITKKIQKQNKELVDLNEENQKLLNKLEENYKQAYEAKEKIENQHKQLLDWKDEHQKLTNELFEEMKKSEIAKIEAENAKITAENDLNILQKKTQFQLVNTIVKMALYVIVGVGFSSSALYLIAIITGKETQMIGSTWSNLLGILLTNAFSIVGTIMGVKYATDKNTE